MGAIRSLQRRRLAVRPAVLAAAVLVAAGLLAAPPAPAQEASQPATQLVPADWKGKPSSVPGGAPFRVLVVSGNRALGRTDIDKYNEFVQKEVTDKGRAELKPYASSFRALASTAAVDARDNTMTNPENGVGVPIYWYNSNLDTNSPNRDKLIAANYADFYSGSWKTRVPTNVRGGDVPAVQAATYRVATGSRADGTGDPNQELGAAVVTAAYPFQEGRGLSGGTVSDRGKVYALSGVLRAVEEGVPYVQSVDLISAGDVNRGYSTGDEIRVAVTFSEAVTVDTTDGSPSVTLWIGVVTGVRRTPSYVAQDSTATRLVFSYTVVAEDIDQDGITVNADSLAGATITKQGDQTVMADRAFHGTFAGAAHRVNHVPEIETIQVTSTPSSTGATYGVGETIEVTVWFGEPVVVDGANGLPTLRVLLASERESENSGQVPILDRVAHYRRTSGRGLVFGYVVAAGEQARELRLPVGSVMAGDAAIRGAASGRDAPLEHVRILIPILVNGDLTPPVSSDATLGGLRLAGADLSPAFAPDTTDYTANVSNEVATVTLTRTTNGPGATSAVTPADADADADGHQVNLAVGDTAITVQVTAGDGTTTQPYRVTVTRAAFTAALSGLPATHDGTPFSFKVEFSDPLDSRERLRQGMQITGGTATAVSASPAGQQLDWEVTVTPDGDADVVVTLPAADDCSDDADLCSGDQPLADTVTDVVRGPGTSDTAAATLSSLAVTGATLSPAFSADTTSYTATIESSASAVTVAATPAYLEGTTVAITPADADEGAAGHQVTVTGAETVITVTVSAGTATRTYTVTVLGTASVAIAAAASPVTEGSAARFTLTRTGATAGTLTVGVTVTESGSFIPSAGYTAPSEAVFAAAAATVALTVETEQDSMYEEHGAITATVTAADNGEYTVGVPAAATVDVEDDDLPPVTLRLAPSEILEGGEVSVVSATLPRAPQRPLTVTVDATPVAPATAHDYALSANRVLNFAADATESRGVVSIAAVDNEVAAANKTITVSGTAVSGTANTAVTSATLAIVDDEGVLTAAFVGGSPLTHDGPDSTVRLSVDFSAPVTPNIATMRAHWQVSGGRIEALQRRDGDPAKWLITLRPDSGADLVVVLPAAVGPCTDSLGPICAAGTGELLWTRLERRLDGPATAPGVPRELTADDGVGEIRLRWTPPANGGLAIERYQYRQTRPAPLGAWTDIPDSGVGGGNETSYLLSGLPAGTTHAYQLRAVNLEGDQGAGEPTEPVAATPRAAAAAEDFTLRVSPAVIREDGGTALVTVSTGVFTAADRTISLTYAGDATRNTDYTATSDALLLVARRRSVTATVIAKGDNMADDGETVVVSARVGADAIGTPQTITITEQQPLTAQFGAGTPTSHQGDGTEFEVFVDFNQAISIAVSTMQSHWQITGGTVRRASRRDGDHARWAIRIRADTAGDVVVTLPVVTGACRQSGGPICTTTSEPLQTRLERRLDGPATAPGTPTDLAAYGGVDHVRLTWSPPADNGGMPIVAYQYRQAVGAGAYGLWTDIPDSGVGQANETSYVHTGLTAGRRHAYQLRAVNEEGDDGLSGPTAVAVATPRAGGDAVPVSVSVAPPSIAEQGGTATVTVSSGTAYFAQDQAFTLSFSGTATEGADYRAGAATLTLSSGATTATGTITAVDDDIDDDGETVIVGASGASSDLAIGSAATLTIDDDDTRGVTVAPTALTVFAGRAGAYTVALESQPTAAVTVAPAVAGSAATAAPAALTFTPTGWRGARTVTVTTGEEAGGQTATVTHTVAGGDYVGETAAEVTVTIATPAVPAAPPGLTAVAGEGQVTLGWRPPDDGGASVSSFEYRASVDAGATWSAWEEVPDGSDPGAAPGDETEVEVTGLDTRPRLFEVRARNRMGPGAAAVSAAVTPLLAAPRDLRAAGGDGEVTLSWGAPAVGIIRHDYRYWTPASQVSWTAIGDSGHGGAHQDTYTVTGLANGTRYRFEVRAVDAGGASGPSPAASAMPAAAGGICGRTAAVSAAIVGALNGDTDAGNDVAGCAQVTASHLQGIAELDLSARNLTALRAGDFAGLTSLRDLGLNGNLLAGLPSRVFDGLRLTELDLSGNRFETMPEGVFLGLLGAQRVRLDDNPGSPLPLTVRLYPIGSRFRAVAAAGAPFRLVVPLRVTNGRVEGGATTTTIAVGEENAATFAVTRAQGSTAAVTVDFGALPALPAGHQGYELRRSAALPLTALAASGAPAAPSSMQFQFRDGEVHLRWGTVPADVIRHEYRYRSTGAYGAWVAIPDSAAGEANERSAAIAGIVSGFTYQFQVRAVNASGAGAAATYAAFVGAGLGICDRGEEVRSAILGLIDGVDECARVTVAHLAAITGTLDLSEQEIVELKAGDLAGLAAIAELNLADNLLTELPSGVFGSLASLTRLNAGDNRLLALPPGLFEGLGALSRLQLSGNANTLPVTVRLQASGEGGFTAHAPTGAPFELVLPVTVANGAIEGGQGTITIPAGALASAAALTVTRTPGTRAAVTAQVGTLPALPAEHAGYRLVKSAQPLTVIEALPDLAVAFGAAAYHVSEGGTVEVTVTVSPPADQEVAIALTASGGGGATAADYRVPATVTVAAGATAATFTVRAVQDGDDDDGERVTLGFGSLPAGVTVGDTATATVALLDDDGGDTPVRFGAVGYEVTEGGTVTVTVTVDAAPADAVAIPLTASGGGGATAADYTVPAAVTVAAGATAATFTVSAEQDGDNDDGEWVTLGFGSLPAGLTAGSPPTTTVALIDDENTAPETRDMTVTTAEDTPYRFRSEDFPFDDADPRDAAAGVASVLVVAAPAEGTLKLDGVVLERTASTTVAAADIGSLVFEPAAEASGDPYTRFGFKVSDGNGGSSDTRIMTIVVTPVNDAPEVATELPDHALLVGEQFSYVVPVDAFTDVEGAALRYAAERADGRALPAWLEFDGAARTFSGTPAAADTGREQVRVTASDGVGTASDEFEIRVYALAVTLAVSPAAIDERDDPDTAAVNEARAEVTATATRAAAAAFTVTVAAAPAADATDGDFTLSANRVLSFAAGDTESSGTVSIEAVADEEVSRRKEIVVSGTVSGATVKPPEDVTVRILEELPEVTIVADASVVLEGRALEFTLTRTGPTTRLLSVGVRVTETGSMMRLNSAPVYFAAGSATEKLSLATQYDEEAEANSEVTVSVDAPAKAGYRVGEPGSATVTVVDDESLPRVALVLAPAAVAETDDAGTADTNEARSVVTARLRGEAHDAAFTVEVSAEAVAPAEAGSFTLSADPVLSFAAGATESTGEVTITAVEDDEDTVDKRVRVSGVPSVAETAVLPPPAVTLTITDDDLPEVTIAAGTSPVAEGTAAAFTLTRAGVTAAALTVAVSVEQTGAFIRTSGGYTVPEQAVFAAGSATTLLMVATESDSTDEVHGSVTAAVSASAGYRVGSDSTATVTVEDDDPATVVLVLTPATVAERDDAGTDAANEARSAVTARLELAADAAFSVEVAAAAVAPAGAEAFTLSGNKVLNFAAGATESTGTVTITAVDDDEDTVDKRVTVSGTVSDTAVANAPVAVTLTITDDDLPEVTIAAGTSPVVEGTNATFTLTRAGVTAEALTVAVDVEQTGAFIRTTGGYTVPERAVFAAGSATTGLTVATEDDGTDEVSGSVTATVDAGAGYRVGGASTATVDVSDDDLPTVELVLSPATVAESDDAGTTDVNEARSVVTARVALAAGEAFTVTVSAAAQAPAGAGAFTLSGSRVLRFAADATESTGEVTITAVEDDEDTPDKRVRVSGTVSDAAVANAPAAVTLTIPDDDLPEVTIAAGTSPVVEGTNATFTLTRAGVLAEALTVAVSVEQTGAFIRTSGGYTVPERAVFAADSATTLLTVATEGDGTDEVNGTITAAVGTGAGYRVGGASSATVDVSDDDLPKVELVLTPATVAERDDPETARLNEARTVVTARVALAADKRFAVTVSAPDSTGYKLSLSRVLLFEVGSTESTGNVTITAVDNATEDGDLTVPVSGTVSDATAAVSPDDATLTITDDEGLPKVTLVLSPAAVAETDDAGTTAVNEARSVVTATLQEAHGAAFTVTVSAAAVAPAQAGAFTLSADPVLSFAAGATESTGEVTITAVDDDEDTVDKRVTVTGVPSVGATVVRPPAAVTLTITDDDLPEVTIAAGTSPVVEGTNATFTLTRAGVLAEALTVAVDVEQTGAVIRTTGGYTVPERAVFAAGSATTRLTVATEDDRTDELDGAVTATVGAGAGYRVGGASTAEVTVSDDDLPSVELVLTPMEVSERDDAGTTDVNEARSVVTARMPLVAGTAFTVTVAAAAVAPAEAGAFTLSGSRVLRFAADATESTGTVTITAVDDEQDTVDKRVTVSGTVSDTAVAQAPDAVTLTIADDDLPVVTIATFQDRVTEGSNVLFRLTRVGMTSEALTVAVSVEQSGDFIKTSGDYTPPSQVVFAPADRTAVLRVETEDDAADETTGSITAAVSPRDGYRAGTASSATVGVDDNDLPTVELVLTPAEVLERDEPGTTAVNEARTVVTARVPLAADKAFTVTVTAPESSGYTLSGNRVLRFAAGATESTGEVTITAVDNATEDGDLTVPVAGTVSDATAAVTPDEATLTIADDEGLPRVTLVLSPAAVAETDDAGTTAVNEARSVVTATLQKAHGAAFTVEVSAAAVAPAESGAFTLSADPVLSFAANATGSTGEVTITAVDDDKDTVDKRVTVTGVPSVGATVVRPPVAATLTITDDDLPEVTIAAGTSPVVEGTNATFTLTRAGVLAEALTVAVGVSQTGEFIRTTGGYTVPERAVFAADSATTGLTVATEDDGTDEVDGSVTATVDAGAGYRVGGASTATVDVSDDDLPTVELVLSPATVAESDDAGTTAVNEARSVVTARVALAAGEAFTVTVSAAAQAPAGAGAFTLSGSRVLRFAADATESTGEVTITAVEDDEDTPDKRVRVSGTVSDAAVAHAPAAVTLTIPDDDLPEVTIAAGISPVVEGTNATFTLTRAGVLTEALTVAVSVSQTGAFIRTTGGYMVPERAVFAADSATTGLTVATEGDGTDEVDGTITAAVGTGAGYRVGGASTAEVTVSDDDLPTVELVLTPATVAESDDAGTTEVNEARSVVTARVPLAAGTAFTVTVAASAEAPAGAGAFTLSGSRVLRFAADATESTGEVTVTAMEDDEDTPDKRVRVSGTVSDTAVANAPAAVTLTIPDDDLPEVTIAAGTSPVVEGTNATFTLTRAGVLAEALTVAVSVEQTGEFIRTTGGYTVPERAVFAADSATTGLTVATEDDGTDEVNGAVTATVDAGAGYRVGGASSAEVTVSDDDLPKVELVLTPVEVSERDEPGTTAVNEARTVVTARVPLPAGKAFTVTVSAPESSGYTLSGNQVLSFAAGATESTGEVTITAVDNAVEDGDRTVPVAGTVSDATAALAPDAATLTIADDEGLPKVTLVLSPAAVAETDDAGTTAVNEARTVVTATLQKAHGAAFTVEVSAAAVAPAEAGAFTLSADPVLSFAANATESTGEVTITAVDDDEDTVDKRVTVSGAPSVAATVVRAPAAVTLTITDDDLPEVTIAAGTSPVVEGTNATFTLTRAGVLAEALTVAVSVEQTGEFIRTTGGYTVPERAVFAAGSATTGLTVATEDDGTDEVDGSVIATVDAGAGYRVGGASSATVDVSDDDLPTVELMLSPTAVAESDDAGTTDVNEARSVVTARVARAAGDGVHGDGVGGGAGAGGSGCVHAERGPGADVRGGRDGEHGRGDDHGGGGRRGHAGQAGAGERDGVGRGGGARTGGGDADDRGRRPAGGDDRGGDQPGGRGDECDVHADAGGSAGGGADGGGERGARRVSSSGPAAATRCRSGRCSRRTAPPRG